MSKIILIFAFFFSGLVTSFAQGAAPESDTEIDLEDKSVKSAEPAKSDSKSNEYDKLLLDFSDFDWDDGSNSKETIKTVTIGTQIWMAENLDVTTFRNGDPIIEEKDDLKWAQKTYLDPAWCYYQGDPANGKKYGKLYNNAVIRDSRGIAPEGWHVPTVAEWNTLINELGGESAAGKKMSSISGFNALSGGSRDSFGWSVGFGESGYWWSSTRSSDTYNLNSAYGFKTQSSGSVSKKLYDSDGLSVRCIKD